MLAITLSLLGGLILSLFGFDAVVMQGMLEVFNKELSTSGYYFLFGVFGALKQLALLLSSRKDKTFDVLDSLSKNLDSFNDKLEKRIKDKK